MHCSTRCRPSKIGRNIERRPAPHTISRGRSNFLTSPFVAKSQRHAQSTSICLSTPTISLDMVKISRMESKYEMMFTAQALYITLDLQVWRKAKTWREAAMTHIPIRGMSYPAASIEFTNDDTVTPDPTVVGESCIAGQACRYGLQKATYQRLGDASGDSVWGNCATKIPYSVPQCQKVRT